MALCQNGQSERSMELPEEKPDRNNALSRQLVSDLENLRDALTRLSLTLQDIAFEIVQRISYKIQ